METSTLQVFLRVLYTVNSSPQYILAKSASQVTTIICSEGTAQPAGYARAPLKACLTAVCNSSPELLQDPERDYSLYVLDPLESQPPPSSLTSTPQNSDSPRGVAVALGLMSWALESNDSGSVHVTGTLTSSHTPALEVVFALRETKRVHRSMPHAFYPWGQATSAPGPSQPAMHFQPQSTGPDWSSTPHLQVGQQEPRTLTRSVDFPELYIGPPRRSRGRPEGSTSLKSKSKLKSLAGDSPLADPPSKSRQEVAVKSKQKAKPRPPRPPPTNSPFICAPLTRHVTAGISSATPSFYQQPYPPSPQLAQSHPQLYPYPQPSYNPLLGLLSAISASTGNMAGNGIPKQQAALLSALQRVLVTNPQLLQLAAAANVNTLIGEATLAANEAKCDDERDDGDSDIVILDSSTVDTAAFRKPGNRPATVDDHDTKRNTPSSTSQQEFPIPPSSQGTYASPMPASTPPSAHDSTPGSSQTSTSPAASVSTPTPSSGEPPISRRTASGRTDGRAKSISPSLLIPMTPTPSHTRKRKLNEYVQGHAHASSSTFPFTVPDSPSPTVVSTSCSTRELVSAMRQRQIHPSPSRSGVLSSSSARLPSMLDAMSASTAARSQAISSGSSTQTVSSSTANRNAKQSGGSVSDPLRSKAEPPSVIATSLSSAAFENGTAAKRRRTLNEVMEEQERERERSRKSSSSKRDASRHSDARAPENATRDAHLRPTKSAPISKHARSSPPRLLFRSDSVTSASQFRASIYKPGSPSYPVYFNPASAPTSTSTSTSASAATSTSTPTVTSMKNPYKNFVLPAWARTDTATLPRLSEEALARQQAEREAKKVQGSLRRREAAKAKRRRVGGATSGADPSKESSADEEETAGETKPRPSLSTTWSAPLLPLPPPPPTTLPVFASDAVEPIPSSPLPSQRSLPPPAAPRTPPRKRVSLGSGPQELPGQPGDGSGSLSTPAGSLFTPSTPNVTHSLSRLTYTPRSPSAYHLSTTKRSPLKSLMQTPKSVHTGRRMLFASPGSVIRTPQTQTSMGSRKFLLSPPSPCSMRTPSQQKGGSGVPGSQSPAIGSAGSPALKSPLVVRKGEQNADSMEDVLGRELDEALHGLDVPNQPSHSAAEEGHEAQETTWDEEVDRAEEDYPSSPLPPSSPPPPTSPLSSPVKHEDTNSDIPTTNNLAVRDSDVLLPSASDSDGTPGQSDTAWLSDDATTAAWFTDSETNAWLSETEAWLTGTEGGPLLADSDVAWLSDSDAIFCDMLSLPPSTTSNWLSDDADVDTDGDVDGTTGGAAAFDAALAHFDGGKWCVGEDVGKDVTAPEFPKQECNEFWEAIQPLLGENGGSNVPDADVLKDQKKVDQNLQTLLNGCGAET